MPQDDLAEVRELARQKVAGFSACLEERAVAINKVNPDLSPIQCWRNERGGGVRLDRAVLSYWTEFDTVPQPASYPRPWDFMRKGHYLHVMFFRDHKGINDQELWLKLPLEPIESAWVMTVHYSRDGGFEQPSQVESRTRLSIPMKSARIAKQSGT